MIKHEGTLKLLRPASGKLDRFVHFPGWCGVAATEYPNETACPYWTRLMTLKVVLEGEEEYRVAGRTYRVSPGRALLIPAGEPYTSRVLSESIQMIPVFINEGLAREIGALTENEEEALEGAGAEPRMRAALLPHDPGLDREAGRLWRLSYGIPASRSLPLEPATALTFQSAVLSLLGKALAARRALGALLLRLDAVKPATREEIHRRLALAEDRMRSSPGADLSLGELARTAGMGSFHFFRRFTDCHGRTPHRFLTELRLAHARGLLTGTDLPIKRVARDSGYRSTSAFIALCHRAWGVSPGALRAGPATSPPRPAPAARSRAGRSARSRRAAARP